MTEQRTTTCVIGGGMLGMALADRLAHQGHAVTLLEAADHLGGLADAWQLGDITWDRHYHVTLLSDHRLRGLLSHLGLDSEMEWVETKTGFFTDGQLHSMSNLFEFLRFPPLDLISKLRLGWTIFYGSRIKDWQPLENQLVADWLEHHSGRKTLEKIWLPLLKSKLGENYQRTSAAFIWATIARLYAARRTGLKKEMFGYVPGGYARIVDVFHQHLLDEGVDVRVSCPVSGVRSAAGGAVEVDTANATTETFDRVVATVPSPVIPRLCPGLTDDEKRRHEGIHYQGIVCASLLLSRPLSRFYVTNITDDGFPFTGVIEMTALVDPRHFGGRSLVYLPHYVPDQSDAFEESDERIRQRCVAGLQRMHPTLGEDEILAFRVSRVRRVMALSTLNYSQSIPAFETSVPHFYVANSAQIVNGTLNVNETVKLAQAAAQQLADSAAPPALAPDERLEDATTR